MRAKSQLNLKGGARTQIRHVADSAVDVFFPNTKLGCVSLY